MEHLKNFGMGCLLVIGLLIAAAVVIYEPFYFAERIGVLHPQYLISSYVRSVIIQAILGYTLYFVYMIGKNIRSKS